ncbi:MAG: ParA family protein, partial [Bdellovibrio sp.]
DFIFIDSPPALSQITSAAHMYSDLVAMPIEMDLFSIDGIDYNIEHINILKQNYGKNLDIAIFVNKYDGRPKADMEILETLKSSNYGRYLCDSYISMSSGLRTTIAGGQTVWESARKHPALVGFENLLFELTNLNFHPEPKKQTAISTTSTEATA